MGTRPTKKRSTEVRKDPTRIEFARAYDQSYKGSKGYEFKGESMTEPNMSKSLQELLINHTRGLYDESNAKEEFFFGDVELKQPKDLTEIQEYREELERELAEVQATLKTLNNEQENETTEEERGLSTLSKDEQQGRDEYGREGELPDGK